MVEWASQIRLRRRLLEGKAIHRYVQERFLTQDISLQVASYRNNMGSFLTALHVFQAGRKMAVLPHSNSIQYF